MKGAVWLEAEVSVIGVVDSGVVVGLSVIISVIVLAGSTPVSFN